MERQREEQELHAEEVLRQMKALGVETAGRGFGFSYSCICGAQPFVFAAVEWVKDRDAVLKELAEVLGNLVGESTTGIVAINLEFRGGSSDYMESKLCG